MKKRRMLMRMLLIKSNECSNGRTGSGSWIEVW